MTRPPRTDRAVSIQLTHVMAIAMTTILVVIVVTGVSGQVQDQRSAGAEQQLSTIGNTLATEVERVDELGQKGGEATLRADVRSTVSGNNYDAHIADGSDCDTSAFTSDDCLVLTASGLDAGATVPLNLTADVSMESDGPGTYVLTAEDGGSEAGVAVDPVIDRRLRIGVGRNFESSQFGTVVDPSNRPPIAKFDFSPGSPRTGDDTEFRAYDSFDPDGEIRDYYWDFDGDGVVDDSGETVSRTLPAGRHEVTLQVVDNEGGQSNVTRTVRVSGLTYENDLNATGEGTVDEAIPNAIDFNVTNEYSTDVNLAQILINPTDPDVDSLENPSESGNFEILLGEEGSSSGMQVFDPNVPESGRIVELDGDFEIDSDETERIRIGALHPFSVNGVEFEIGIRYEVGDQTNSTVFTDVAGSPSVDEFEIVTRGEDVYGRVTSNWELDFLRVETGGVFDGAKKRPSLSPGADPPYEFQVHLGEASEGTVKANLTDARIDDVEASETQGSNSINVSRILFDTNYVWQSTADWDANTDQVGVVHDDVGARESDSVMLGYPPHDQWESDLAGYWPFDGSADSAGAGNDGSESGDLVSDLGVFGHNPGSYVLDGDDYVDTGSDLDELEEEPATLSAWVKTDANGDNDPEDAPGIAGVDADWWDTSVYWGWMDWDGYVGIRVDDEGAMSDTQVNDGAWHHVAFTFDEERGWHEDPEVAVYVDGQREDVEEVDESDIDSDFSSLGRIEDAEAFDGHLDEVRTYDRALSDDEIEQLATFEGSLTTDWKTGSAIDPSDLELQNNASVPPDTWINVTVEADTDGDGDADETSRRISLEDGETGAAVEGLSSSASSYRLVIEMESDSPTKSPALHTIVITDDS